MEIGFNNREASREKERSECHVEDWWWHDATTYFRDGSSVCSGQLTFSLVVEHFYVSCRKRVKRNFPFKIPSFLFSFVIIFSKDVNLFCSSFYWSSVHILTPQYREIKIFVWFTRSANGTVSQRIRSKRRNKDDVDQETNSPPIVFIPKDRRQIA